MEKLIQYWGTDYDWSSLGYDRYVVQGGDWGALITEQMALIAPPELIAIHTNMRATLSFWWGCSAGRIRVLIEVVDPEGPVFTKQAVSFDAPGKPDHL